MGRRQLIVYERVRVVGRIRYEQVVGKIGYEQVIGDNHMTMN